MRIEKIIKLGEVDSTNKYARGQVVPNEADEGAVVLARHQTQGRGAGGNSWESENGKNLTFSIHFKPVFLEPARQFYLSMAVSLGVADFISGFVSDVSVKWPNDIYVADKKIAGILIENIIAGRRISDSVVGIGININQERFVGNAPNPVSLKQLTGVDYVLGQCLETVCNSVFKWYDLLRGEGKGKILENYLPRLFRVNRWAEFRTGGKIFRGKITGIDEFGELIIETAESQVMKFGFKEVEYLFNDKVI